MKDLISYVRNSAVGSPGVVFCSLLVLADILLSTVIVAKVPYTEIDWVAYMEEVEGFESGERNYTKIQGNTGPLVYPAGFLYVFSILKWLTSNGSDIFKAQIIFAGIYILTLSVSLVLYYHSKCPAYSIIFLIVSKRVHSIFMLRMFNDCIAIFLGISAIVLFCSRNWRWGSIVYSFAVSIKMNLLLFAPGVLAIYLLHLGIFGAIENICICGIVQVFLAYPFLSTYPIEYLTKAFELNRVFFYKWTVNFRFLPENIFLDKRLSIFLLVVTVIVYCSFGYKWTSEFRKGFSEVRSDILFLTSRSTKIGNYISWNFITYVIFASNFIGIAFARSLHYQFYCWYFFTLPLLLFQSYLSVWGSIVIMAVIEYSYNVFPATEVSSGLLQLAHLVLLVALWFSRVPFNEGRNVAQMMRKDD